MRQIYVTPNYSLKVERSLRSDLVTVLHLTDERNLYREIVIHPLLSIVSIGISRFSGMYSFHHIEVIGSLLQFNSLIILFGKYFFEHYQGHLPQNINI